MSASTSATKKKLPPDPERLNDKRAGWAGNALNAFIGDTGVDPEDCVADLIANLRHWCDRNGQDFERELARGWEMYEQETKRGQ